MIEEKQFILILNGEEFISPDKYVVDFYGNRYMIFESKSRAFKIKVYRDDLEIDMVTGKCKLKPGKRVIPLN
ncbi:MAG: hypothetical protein QXF15_01935 [Candidatus Aenigmatarchaeota archaeon]|nr:hypothetical protein [Candidatus Aenigmarchaeota archaeon]